jgi:TRAP-type mannitol/chloroaromatic compound transport system substrate-binding protein
MPTRTRTRRKISAELRRLNALMAALVLAVLTATGGAGPSAAQSAPEIRITMPVLYGTHLPGLGKPARDWALLLQDLSGKTIRVSILQPGQGPAPQELLDAVSSGKVGAAFTRASFWADRLPAASLFAGFPFGPDAAEYAAWYEAGNGSKLYQKMYDEAGLSVHVIPCAFAGGETSGWYAKPVESVEDIEGLRIRIFGQGGLVMRKLGAEPVITPGSKLAESFKSGDLDAAELYPPAVDAEANPASIAKYVYLPGWHQPETVMELLVNKDRWDALSDRQQGWIETACKANLLQTMADNRVTAAEALRGFAGQGVEIKTWPEPVLDAFRRSWEEVAADEARRDKLFAEVLDDLRAFQARKTPLLTPPPPGGGEPLTASTEAEDASQQEPEEEPDVSTDEPSAEAR